MRCVLAPLPFEDNDHQDAGECLSLIVEAKPSYCAKRKIDTKKTDNRHVVTVSSFGSLISLPCILQIY